MGSLMTSSSSAGPIQISEFPEPWRSKFGGILQNGLGGDSMTDRWTDGRMDGGINNIPNAFFKKSVVITTKSQKTNKETWPQYFKASPCLVSEEMTLQ